MVKRKGEPRVADVIDHPVHSRVDDRAGLVIRLWLGLPPKGTNPNARCRWRMKAQDVASYRHETRLVSFGELNRLGIDKPKWKRATVKVTYCHMTQNFRDRDNIIASMKSAFDGLQDAGVIDDDRELMQLPPERLYCPDRPGVLVEIWQGHAHGLLLMALEPERKYGE